MKTTPAGAAHSAPEMSALSDPQIVTRLEASSRICALAVIAIGIAVLAGHAIGSAFLVRLSLQSGGMAANTAAAFLLSGTSLLLRMPAPASRRRQLTANVVALVVLLIGALTLSEYVLNRDFGLDQWLFKEVRQTVLTKHPGRMAEGTAASFAALGAAQVLIGMRGVYWRLASQVLCVLVLAFALIGFYAMGFGAGAVQLYEVTAYFGIALPTLVGLLLLTVAILSADVISGPMAIIAAPGVGGRLARRLLPVALVVPPVIGWLRLLGDESRLFPHVIGVAMVALANVAIFTVVIWLSARMLERLDKVRSRAETELRHVGLYNRSLLEASLDPLVTIGPDGRLTDVNAAAESVTGQSRDRLIGSDFSDYFTEPEKAREGYREVFKEGFVRDYPLEIRHRDGRVMPVLYNASVYRDETGKVVGVFAAARDITAIRKAEGEIRELNASLERRVAERTAQLEGANKDLESFSYSVSHDLRAPLRAIDNFSQFLLDDYADKLDAEGQRLLNVVRSNTGKMSRLIDDILAFSRAGRRELVMSDIDMNALFQDVFTELLPAAGARKINLQVPVLPHAYADPASIRQVVTNLLSNAIKFTRDREIASIEVSGETTDGEVSYSVKDNGAGFDPQYTHKLFGVFQRLHGQEYEGSGIGLAIVKRFIDKHGGRVSAESVLGEGATFRFSLPRHEPSPVSGGTL